MATRTQAYKDMLSERIKAGKIVKRLQDHVDGKVELSNTQVQAARILLGKVVPDKTASTVDSTVEIKDDTTPSDSDRREARAALHAINGGKPAS